MTKWFLCQILASSIISLSPLYAMDTPLTAVEDNKDSSPLYARFKGVTVENYVSTCFPKLPSQKKAAAIKIINALSTGEPTPIAEDDSNPIADLLGKEMSEGGYSHPHNLASQGPLLEFCGEGTLKKILDIGAGDGNDTIPLLLTHNVQVITVDIQQKQLNVLKEKVQSQLKDDFSIILEKNLFSTMKRNFALEGSVPDKYKNAFDGANLSRVLHFVANGRTMIKNIAIMLKEDSILSLTTLAIKPGSREEEWLQTQEKEGLTDPGLIYYDVVTSKRNNTTRDLSKGTLNREYKLVKRENVDLSGPGRKRQFTTQDGPYAAHTIRQGRYYYTPDSLKKLLDPYFTILDSTLWEFDKESYYLSVIAKRNAQSGI